MSDEVGGQHENRAGQRRARDDEAMVQTDDRADDVGDHEADETDGPRDGDGGAGENEDGGGGGEFNEAGTLTQAACNVLTEHEYAERRARARKALIVPTATKGRRSATSAHWTFSLPRANQSSTSWPSSL